MALVEKLDKWTDLPLVVASANLTNGFVAGMFSDHLYTGLWRSNQEQLMKEHAAYQLECVRIFDEKHELKIFRNAAGFLQYRDTARYQVVSSPDDVPVVQASSENLLVNTMQEVQLLDIDASRTTDLSEVYATGGGLYCLEGSGLTLDQVRDAQKKPRVILEDYIRYYESGQAFVCDWRIVRFADGREELK